MSGFFTLSLVPTNLRTARGRKKGPRTDREIVQIMEDYCPGFADSVEHIEVLAPADIEKKFGLIGGNIMQGEMTREPDVFIPTYSGLR